jgi:hypothetical protein
LPARKAASARKLAPDLRLNPRLKRHIKSLNLSCVSDYQNWCKENGFRAALSKNLHQLRREIAYSKKAVQESRRRTLLDKHIRDMGFQKIGEYQEWCRKQDLGDGLYKSPSQRQKEKQLKLQLNNAGVLSSTRHQIRYISETVYRIASGQVKARELTNPGLREVHRILTDMTISSETRKAFLKLSTSVLPKADFLDMNPVIAQLGLRPGNSYISALFALSRHHYSWVRPPKDWSPGHRNLLRQFGSLTRHLLAMYYIPSFMDSAWFLGNDSQGELQQNWFIHIGIGKNIRTADLPVRFTKNMAHRFLQAPDRYTVNQALRWAQIMGLGGDQVLTEHIISTRLGEVFEDDEFWVTVLHFFINNSMLDYDYIGPIVDYVYHQRYAPRQVMNPDVIEIGPPQPNFIMKGRKVRPLLLLVEEWHTQLAKERRSPHGSWDPSGIPDFRHIEEDKSTGRSYLWTIRELLTRNAVIEEGKSMRHCVGSYVPACMKGSKSVWSMQVEDMETNSSRRVMTIAIKNDTRSVAQARGKCNVLPDTPHQSRRAAQLLRRDEELLKKGKALMYKWGKKEGIHVPRT